jgi:hypothetical protein
MTVPTLWLSLPCNGHELYSVVHICTLHLVSGLDAEREGKDGGGSND